jgi:hypothetical protein
VLDYATGPTADTHKRERRYTIGAAILGALYAWSGVFMLFRAPKLLNQNDVGKWLFRGVGLFELALALALVAIAVLRYRKPHQRSLTLLILNALVLIAFPFGTVLSLYYFLRLRPLDTQP